MAASAKAHEWCPGVLFEYDAGRRFLVFRVSGIGEILRVDNHCVCIRLYRVESERLVPFVNFAPITPAAFERSHPVPHKKIDTDDRWCAAYERWRQEEFSGEAGVFDVPIRKVVLLALETIQDGYSAMEDGWPLIHSSWPKRASDGAMRRVAVELSD